MSNLVDLLTQAAVAAIANERPDLEREPERLRGVVLELSINRGRGGGVTAIEGVAYVERRLRPAGRPTVVATREAVR